MILVLLTLALNPTNDQGIGFIVVQDVLVMTCSLLCLCPSWASIHFNDVIMTTMASQITSLTVVYTTVYSDADQRKHQSSASLAFVWGIQRDR